MSAIVEERELSISTTCREYITDNSINVWWETENDKCHCAWIKHAAVHPSHFKETLSETIEHLGKIGDKDKVTCIACGKVIQRKRVGGRKFAGHFCGDCWETYKAANNRVCQMCGKPEYECRC